MPLQKGRNQEDTRLACCQSDVNEIRIDILDKSILHDYLTDLRDDGLDPEVPGRDPPPDAADGL